MFIKQIDIENFRVFQSGKVFSVGNLNTPDKKKNGSGLNIFIGENGCGKTTLLDAFALPLLGYKADAFSLTDINNPEFKTHIKIFADKDFGFDGTMPKSKYQGKGFLFEGGLRSRDSKGYLSSIVVSDQKYIKSDTETKLKDNSPDTRLNVNNPWKGARFAENDILFLDKNRTYQIRSGSYNTTRFDRLMEDFDFQYIKESSEINDFNETLKSGITGISNDFLTNAINKFQEVSGYDISLSFMDNWRPHKDATFSVLKDSKRRITLDMLGSGYEMIFSLIYSFYLSTQSGKDLIILIDEPELHLHPKLQNDFVNILLEFSKTAQIIITTHSPLLIKQIFNTNLENDFINVLYKEDEEIKTAEIDRIALSYISANEINYIAFGLSTEEYHNELFEELKIINGENLNIYDFDKNYFQEIKKEEAKYIYNGNPSNKVSIHTQIRTQIHHRGTAGAPNATDIENSIKKMREFLLTT